MTMTYVLNRITKHTYVCLPAKLLGEEINLIQSIKFLETYTIYY